LNAGHTLDDTSPQVRSPWVTLIVVLQHIEPYIGHVYDKYCELHDFKTRRRDFPKDRILKVDSFINALGTSKLVAQLRAWPNASKAANYHNKEALRRIRDLSDTLDGARTEAPFCCGGTVFIPTNNSEARADFQAGLQSDVEPLLHSPRIAVTSTNGPAIIHWDSMSNQMTHKLAFSGNMTMADTGALHVLISSSSFATFGRDGLDAPDESYRQAVKLEPSQFTTNFHPANHGILDDIRQVLLQAYVGSDGVDGMELRLHAEMYKLNVYSSPFGKFKTPTQEELYLAGGEADDVASPNRR
jgi:hypothetical protein